MKKRPNVLFLMSDEHRADVAGFAGNTLVRTPVLDELARGGVVFDGAYTPSPICIPARQSLAAGQLPKTCGVRNFGDDLAPNYQTWARVFSQNGYNTLCCGKLHHLGPDQMQGWRRRISFDDIRVSGVFVDGMKPQTPNLKWSDAKEIVRAGIGKSPHAIADDFAVSGAERFVDEYFCSPFYDKQTPDEPLVLKVSLLLPHYPYLCDEELFSYYLNRVQPFEEETFDHPFLKQRAVRNEVSAREIRRATAAYHGMVETIDAQFGKVLTALRRAGQDLDDWIIVYTSDHGEMLGQHGIWEKQKFFEGSARVPLWIRWPKQFEARRVSENVNLCDLFATLCELCELPIPPNLDSRSLVPLLRGEAGGWNNESISQFGSENLMIKRDALKYQSYGSKAPEVLFDLKTDPGETINFAFDSKYSAAMSAFRQRRDQLGYGPSS